MNNKQLSKIARNTNTSSSTVSKVLNNCYGVSGKVRDLVYDEASKVCPENKKREPVSIYVIMPENPEWFWECSLPRPKNTNIDIKYNIYSRLGDTNIVNRYLDQATEHDAKVIILVSLYNEKTEEKVKKLSESKLIIHLTEFNDTVNTFYIGSDAYSDGRMLADICRGSYVPGNKTLILKEKLPEVGKTSELRLKGFTDEIGDPMKYDIVDFELEQEIQSMPALLARKLSDLFSKERYSSIVCLNGYLPTVCLTVQKMKLPYRVSCFGFEESPQSIKYAGLGLLGCAVIQNFQLQLQTALDIAEYYIDTRITPGKKYIYIPSIVKKY